MEVAAWSLSVLGAALSLGAAVWLQVGFKPTDERYLKVDARFNYSIAEGVGNLLRDQARAGSVAVAGATLQLVGVALAVVSL